MMMQNFKDFINEEHTEPNYIEVDSRMIEHNKDAINADFDRLTAQPYTNAVVFFNQVRGTLERYGMIVPQTATRHFLNFDGEFAFKLGESPFNLYIVFNTHKNAYVDGYAQIVDDEELDALMSSDFGDDEAQDESDEVKDEEEDDMSDEMDVAEKYRKRRDDDSGNTSEY